MTCLRVQKRLAGYLDGTLRGSDHARVREHLESCAGCRGEFQRYVRLAALVARVEPAAPPADLAVRIRVAASEDRSVGGWLSRVGSHAGVVARNLIEPFAVPATGGLVTALFFFALVAHNLLFGLPLGAVANDHPLNLFEPARVERLAAFPITTTAEAVGETDFIVVAATVDARGQVTDFEIIAGPNDAAVQRQVYQVLLFSRFRPRMGFGRPEAGGRVLLQFSEIRVRG
jgi:hypothetical protein